jgi:hypothetical protein
MKSCWSEILSDKEPALWLKRGYSFEYEVKDVASPGGACDDIVRLGLGIYAVVNRRVYGIGFGNNQVISFFSASSPEAILHCVYGYADKAVSSGFEPPEELLVMPGLVKFGQMRRYAEQKGLDYNKYFIQAQQTPAPSFASMCVGIRRLKYYFTCAPEEDVEMKDWDSEPVVVMGYKTGAWSTLEKWIPGAS